MKVGGIDGGQLRSFIEQYEDQQQRLDEINEERGETMKRVEGAGLNKKIFKVIIKRRRTGKDRCAEEDMLIALYERALEEDPLEGDEAEPRARTREEAEPAAAAV
ncbi:MAG TPA: GapR family DNA-binding domain-containing protein [Stellaceae bacterium]|jgi:uncharacterized protein (UPF0335 family)|nr:GapR family DNA-binding domain-containing protein [Stellaceae bacterium]